MSTGWPVLLKNEEIFLRPLRFRDHRRWNQVRAENREWLSPWEATIPAISEDSYKELPSYYEMVKILNHEARNGRSFSFAIWHGNNLIGQISLGGVIYGAMRGAILDIGLIVILPIADIQLRQLKCSRSTHSRFLNCIALRLICDQKMPQVAG